MRLLPMMLPTSLMLMLMLGWSGLSARPLQAPEPPGKAPYARVCQVCHGAEGRGDAGPSLVPLDKDYDEVLAIVREGGGQMPPITAERVSDDEVRQIVEYLKSLKAAADHGGIDDEARRHANRSRPRTGA